MKTQTFSIITPNYNALPWLKHCLASVMDQKSEELHIHHHIQDGQSSDGSREYLEKWEREKRGRDNYSMSYKSQADKGMYQALNRALKHIPETSQYIAHLNSDEQYLPKVLRRIVERFEQHQEADILLGGYIIIDAKQQYICHRRPVQPRLWSSWSNCACITNSCFMRGRVKEHLEYGERWKCIGDMELFRKLVEKKLRFRIIPEITSTFECTGSNLAWTERAEREWEEMREEIPRYAAWGRGLIERWVNMKRRVRDLYMEAPEGYEIYGGEGGEREGVGIGEGRATSWWGGRTVAD